MQRTHKVVRLGGKERCRLYAPAVRSFPPLTEAGDEHRLAALRPDIERLLGLPRTSPLVGTRSWCETTPMRAVSAIGSRFGGDLLDLIVADSHHHLILRDHVVLTDAAQRLLGTVGPDPPDLAGPPLLGDLPDRHQLSSTSTFGIGSRSCSNLPDARLGCSRQEGCTAVGVGGPSALPRFRLSFSATFWWSGAPPTARRWLGRNGWLSLPHQLPLPG